MSSIRSRINWDIIKWFDIQAWSLRPKSGTNLGKSNENFILNHVLFFLIALFWVDKEDWAPSMSSREP